MSANSDNNHINIDELQHELSSLKEKRENTSSELEKYLEQRSKFNDEFKKKKDIVKELKEKRDALNKKVHELKDLRDTKREEALEKRQEIKELQNELCQIKANPKGRSADTRAELERLEWEIQTTPMTKDQERGIIERIANLEAKLKLQSKIESARIRQMKLREAIYELDQVAESAHQELIRLVDESEVYHNKMMNHVDGSNDFKTKADEAHNKFVETKETLRNIQKEYITILATVKSIRKKEIEEQKKEEETKKEEFKKNREEKASNKLKKGDKLSFDEFKILIEKGMI